MGISPILANKLQNLVLGGTAFSANGTSVSLQLWDSGGSKAAYSGYADLSLDSERGGTTAAIKGDTNESAKAHRHPNQ